MFIHDSIRRAGDCQVGHGPKSIVLQLEDKIGVVEGRSYGRWIDGLDAGEGHNAILSTQRQPFHETPQNTRIHSGAS
jgi:hypothetical protein